MPHVFVKKFIQFGIRNDAGKTKNLPSFAICSGPLYERMHRNARQCSADTDTAHAEFGEIAHRKTKRPRVQKIDRLRRDGLHCAVICSRVLMPGKYRQSAPASAKAFSRRIVSSRSGRFRINPSVRPVRTTSPPALSIASRAAPTRLTARSSHTAGPLHDLNNPPIDNPATPVSTQS